MRRGQGLFVGNFARNTNASTPFTPSSLPGLQLWLDAADASTILLNGSNVAQWNDKSTNAYNVIQPTSTKQPAYVTNSQNGHNIVRFDGIIDILSNSTAPNATTTLNTMIVAASVATNATYSGLVGLGDTGATNNSTIGDNPIQNTSGAFWCGGDTEVSPYSSDIIQNTGWHSLMKITDGTYINGYFDNNNTIVNYAHAYSFTNPYVQVGSYLQSVTGGFCASDTGEVIIYNRVLSSTERTQVYNYLKAKWSTP